MALFPKLNTFGHLKMHLVECCPIETGSSQGYHVSAGGESGEPLGMAMGPHLWQLPLPPRRFPLKACTLCHWASDASLVSSILVDTDLGHDRNLFRVRDESWSILSRGEHLLLCANLIPQISCHDLFLI